MSKYQPKFFGIGVGPGDPELLTLKAVKALKLSRFIFEACSAEDKISIAGSIAKEFAPKNATFVPLKFPMTTDKKIQRKAWIDNAEKIYNKISSGFSCSFVTIGDPMLYSTCAYLLRELKKKLSPEQIEIIPGVSSIQILSAKALTPIAQGSESILIYPAFSEKLLTKIKNAKAENIIIMKPYKNKNSIVNYAKSKKIKIIYATNLCLNNENLSSNPTHITSLPEQYLSIFLLKKNKNFI